MIKLNYIRRPLYYKDFYCIGGSCPRSCCVGWQINWTKKSVEKLKNTDCSEKLRNLIETSFEEKGNDFIIRLDENKRCPFLTDDNFCGIQRELGAEYLSPTCTNYPRNFKDTNNFRYNYCNLSCYCVIDKICTDENSMELENYKPINKIESHTDLQSVKSAEKNSAFKYREELLEFFYEIISDKNRSTETSIVLGALAAQKIDAYTKQNPNVNVPEILKQLKLQLNDPSIIKSIEDIKIKPDLRLIIQTKTFDKITGSEYMQDKLRSGILTFESYDEGMKKFKEGFADRDYILRNIALNYLLELGIPFIKRDMSIFENYSYFTAVIACVKLIAVTSFFEADDPEKNFKLGVTNMDRRFVHYLNAPYDIRDLLNEFNCKSPAYLAAIIK